jgi:hypothetical protein
MHVPIAREQKRGRTEPRQGDEPNDQDKRKNVVAEAGGAAQEFSETEGTKESVLGGHRQRTEDSVVVTVSSPSDTGAEVSNVG